MPRLHAVDHDSTGLLEQTRRQLGRVPNLYASMAAGPAALSGYLAMRDALTDGELTPRLREQIALLVAQLNACTYCVSAHALRSSRLLHMSAQEVSDTRSGLDADPHAQAVLTLTRRLVEDRGRVADADITDARAHGVTDGEMAEITAHIALNTLSNYFNHLAQPELDFPEMPA
ncbi:carboxymuconolactone decarboxylase family protein [Lysobacter korlensis]|uniref:Carboxymuconolactone decarboxylase family protein n=1 Tax=Lysobacter korlensis TaxID=553636 RepID=A0ABV6RW97_9GAMM